MSDSSPLARQPSGDSGELGDVVRKTPASRNEEVWAVVGSRGFHDYDTMERALHAAMGKYGAPLYIVSGGAQGADALAWSWAEAHELQCVEYRPYWDSHGKRAGIIRNRLMVQAADRVFAFIVEDVMTPGTRSTVGFARELGLPVEVISDGSK